MNTAVTASTEKVYFRASPGSPVCVSNSLLASLLEVLGHCFTYFRGPGNAKCFVACCVGRISWDRHNRDLGRAMTPRAPIQKSSPRTRAGWVSQETHCFLCHMCTHTYSTNISFVCIYIHTYTHMSVCIYLYIRKISMYIHIYAYADIHPHNIAY